MTYLIKKRQNGGDFQGISWETPKQECKDNLMMSYIQRENDGLYSTRCQSNYEYYREEQEYHNYVGPWEKNFCRPADYTHYLTKDEKVNAVPLGEAYNNSESGTGGCPAAVEKAMLDYFRTSYDISQVDKDRLDPEFGNELIPYHRSTTTNCFNAPQLTRLTFTNDPKHNSTLMNRAITKFYEEGNAYARYFKKHFCNVTDMYKSFDYDGKTIVVLKTYNNATGSIEVETVPFDDIKYESFGTLYQYSRKDFNPRTGEYKLIPRKKI